MAQGYFSGLISGKNAPQQYFEYLKKANNPALKEPDYYFDNSEFIKSVVFLNYHTGSIKKNIALKIPVSHFIAMQPV